MHGLAVMAERFLREPFRIAALFGPFRPGITVTMQRYVHDPQPDAAALEILSTILFLHRGKPWE
jgi:hypothetical protein